MTTRSSSKKALAVAFLREQLSSGPRLQKELLAGAGCSERTLQLAARLVGVERARDGLRGPWVLRLR